MMVQHKTVSLPIGVDAIPQDNYSAERIKKQYGNRKIVFSLGRLVPYKGFCHLIDAASYLDDDYVVLIGGTGPLKDELEHQIARLGLEDKVKLLGRIPDQVLLPTTMLAEYFVSAAYRKPKLSPSCRLKLCHVANRLLRPK